MISFVSKFNLKEPAQWFCFAWCLILLAPVVRFLPALQTFMHPYRAELAASLVFLLACGYLLFRHHDNSRRRGGNEIPPPVLLDLSRPEINYIVLPLLALVAWSGLSAVWASPSRAFALYHTLIWAQYLIFYLLARQILSRAGGLKAFLLPLSATLLILGLPPVTEYLQFLTLGGTTNLGMRYAKYGELFNTVCPLLMVAVLGLDGKRFAAGVLLVVASWLFIISSLGRTNLVLFASGLAVIAAAVFAFRRFHHYRRKTALVVLAVVLTPLPLHLVSLLNEEPNIPLVNRLKDEAGVSYSSDVRRLLKSVSLEMFRDNALTGVGAGNFGMRFNEYRARHAASNPGDVNLMTAEAEIAERSHNEYLQILAELGAPGGAILLWFLAGVGLMGLRALINFRRVSLHTAGALFGIGFFLASSFISSFSFRLVQNGFVFFFVLAVAARNLFAAGEEESAGGGAGAEKVESPASRISLAPARLRLACVLAMIASLVLGAYCFMRGASVYYTEQALAQADVEEALPYFQTALRLDAENPRAHFGLAQRFLSAARYAEAAREFRLAIDGQRATIVDYSYLITAQKLSGDTRAAEETAAEALSLYPFSTYMHARYAALLKESGRFGEAAAHLEMAQKIDRRQANTWWALITEGGREASLRASSQNENYVVVMKLAPEGALYAFTDERDILHPEERSPLPPQSPPPGE